jgi:hypothetical protein
VEPIVFEVARGITAIDTFYGGRERATAAYLLDADEPAIIETGPSTSFEPVVSGSEPPTLPTSPSRTSIWITPVG